MSHPAEFSGQHDLGAEQAVLASIMLDAAALDEVADILTAEDFYSRRNGVIFGAMQALHARSEPIDLITLRSELSAKKALGRAGGEEALLELTEVIPHVAAVEVYAKRVRALSTVRAMVKAAMGVVARAREPLEDVDAFLDEAEAALHGVALSRRSDARSESMRTLIPRVIEAMIERPQQGEVRGVPTGIVLLDKALSGLQPQQLIVLAGRPGMGKSALAGEVAMRAATGERGGPTLVWTGEMAREMWGERMLVSESAVEGDAVRSGRWSRNDWNRIEQAARALVEAPITIDDTPAISLWQLRSKARRMKAREGLALIVVDYLQLMRSGERHQSRELEVSAISRGLKALAKELSVPVLALSQLNRTVESRSDKRPGLSDLRESGAIEQDADAVLFLYREGYYDEDAPATIAEIIVAKQRSGRTGTVQAFFDASTMKWGNLAADGGPPDDGPDDFADPDAGGWA